VLFVLISVINVLCHDDGMILATIMLLTCRRSLCLHSVCVNNIELVVDGLI